MISTLIAYAALVAVQQQKPDLTESEKRATIESLLSALDESYVFPDLAEKAGAKVRKLLSDGKFKGVEAPQEFAQMLSTEINAVLNDAHFRVLYSVSPLPEREDAREPSSEEVESARAMIRRNNAGIERVERLEGNIGYIEVRSFMGGADIARPAEAAFEFLKDTDALILDLSRNGGGDPEAVRILCSYLFSETPVHLNSIYWRPNDETTEFWTLEDLPGTRYIDKPVFVLTSGRTGSGAEECAYNLQTRKRATIVGEVTWGGANPGGVVRLNDHFRAFVPMGRAINPITGTNWEGTGVLPDVDVPSNDSLAKAQVLAIEQLLKTADGPWSASLKRRLEQLQGS